MNQQSKQPLKPEIIPFWGCHEELQAALKLLSGLVKDQLITVKEASKRAGLTEEEFVEKMNK